MPLAAGTRLGHFEVVVPLGSGGMGEVYRARDLDLERDVALKVLPEEFTLEPARLARFGREARAAAALNHPNILTVFEVGASNDTPFVVFELLSGQTLRLLMGRPLGVRRTVGYVTEIARGLAAAHDKGVVHRDIKPENLFVTADGHLKILDFGIAKLADERPDADHRSTFTAPGAVIGTTGYMAPEQVRGEAVDARADVFALGAVFYEMLTGRRAFPGESVTESFSAILKDHPTSVTDLVPDVPVGVARVVHRCLEKQRGERFQSARDIVFALEAAVDPSPGVRPVERPWGRWAAVALVALTAGVLGGVLAPFFRPGQMAMPSIGAVITTPPSAQLGYGGSFVPFALSSDGTTLSYISAQPERMFLRRLDSFDVTELAGAFGGYDPFFSPDNQWIGFWKDGDMKKVAVAGGPAVLVCRAADMMGASWAENGTIVFSPGAQEGLFAVSANGGTPHSLTTLDSTRRELQHAFPQHISNGRAVLFTAISESQDAPFSVELYDLATKVRRTIVPGAQYGRLLPTGHLVYVRDRTLFAVKVAAETLEPLGAAVAVLKDVQTGRSGEALLSVAANGTLAYVPYQAPINKTLVWVDRAGATTDTSFPARPYDVPRLSRDGRTIAVTIDDGTSADIWLSPVDRATLDRVTFGRRNQLSFITPAFFPDGTRLAYAEDTSSGSRVVTRALDGSRQPEEVLAWSRRITPQQVASNGALLMADFGTTSGADIIVLHPGSDAPPTALVRDPGNQWGAVLSLDQRYIAYASDETGRYEIFMRPYPGPGPKRQLTTEGGGEVRWSRDGREIYYRNGGRMMARPIATTPSVQVGRARVLFEDSFFPGAAGEPAYDVSPDGRFLMMRAESDTEPRELRVVTNWFSELNRLVP